VAQVKLEITHRKSRSGAQMKAVGSFLLDEQPNTLGLKGFYELMDNQFAVRIKLKRVGGRLVDFFQYFFEISIPQVETAHPIRHNLLSSAQGKENDKAIGRTARQRFINTKGKSTRIAFQLRLKAGFSIGSKGLDYSIEELFQGASTWNL
jgi:hypothetical protein